MTIRRAVLVILILTPIRLWAQNPVEIGGNSAGKQTDRLHAIQAEGVGKGKSPIAHWGSDPEKYTEWNNHSNRLIPIYTFGTANAGRGIDLETYTNANSPYRSAERLKRIYGYEPAKSVFADANYADQTNIFDIQKAALAAGKRNIFLVIFDGMDWHATRAAAIAVGGKVYTEGRGEGLFLQQYDAHGTSQFGYMVTSPYGDKARIDVDRQEVGKTVPSGGYDLTAGGPFPWSLPPTKDYIKGLAKGNGHAFTDSSSSASSMSAGIKTYNAAVNILPDGKKVTTIAHLAQQAGYVVGTVTSVAIDHATPASMYAHNVSRSDYQDLARDMLGLPSISHPNDPLPGLDVVIGTGFGNNDLKDASQGDNFVPGNIYLADPDRAAVSIEHGGKYVVSERTSAVEGRTHLLEDADRAAAGGHRLLGYYGTRYAHLPFRTADGDYRPAPDRSGNAQVYTAADLRENPSLTDMADAALRVLASRKKPIWLMVEAGDVDLAEHQDNLDTMVGAIISGDKMVEFLAKWVEANSNWKESVMIVTADHGHYLVIDDPEALRNTANRQ